MKIKALVFLLMGVLTAPAFADKPASAGKGNSNSEHSQVHRSDVDKNKHSEKVKGIEKQQYKKAQQKQKELEKGSEQGKESREKRRKWWKFWSE